MGFKRPISLWAMLRVRSDFEELRAFLRGSISTNTYTIDSKLDIRDGKGFYLSGKYYTFNDNFHFYCIGKYSFNKSPYKTYNALVAYKESNYDLLFEHVSKRNDIIEIGEFNASGYYRYGQHTGGLRLTYRPNKRKISKRFEAVIGGIFTFNKNTVLKAKINHKGDFSTALKWKINDHLSTLFRSTISLKEPNLLGEYNKLPFGIQFIFNY